MNESILLCKIYGIVSSCANPRKLLFCHQNNLLLILIRDGLIAICYSLGILGILVVTSLTTILHSFSSAICHTEKHCIALLCIALQFSTLFLLEQNRTEQNRTEQNRIERKNITEQNRTKRNETKRNETERNWFLKAISSHDLVRCHPPLAGDDPSRTKLLRNRSIREKKNY